MLTQPVYIYLTHVVTLFENRTRKHAILKKPTYFNACIVQNKNKHFDIVYGRNKHKGICLYFSNNDSYDSNVVKER